MPRYCGTTAQSRIQLESSRQQHSPANLHITYLNAEQQHQPLKNRHVQDGGALKADVGDRSVHHHHPSVKHLRATLQQTEHRNATRACIIKGCVWVHKIKAFISNPHKGNVTEQRNQEETDFLCCWSGPNPSTSAECADLHQQDRAVNLGGFISKMVLISNSDIQILTRYCNGSATGHTLSWISEFAIGSAI